MKAIVTKYLNVRVGKPAVNAPCYQYLSPGSEIEVDGKLYKGDVYEQSDLWLKDGADNYYWSGGLRISNPLVENVPWWMAALKIPAIWADYKEFGASATIAVLDTGYAMNTPDVAKAVAGSEIFFQPNTGISDTQGHGSHCLSLAGGRNEKNITGCAPQSKIYVGKISEKGALKTYGILVSAIQWAINNKVDIISISTGGEAGDDALKQIINDAVTKHNIVVISSIGDCIPNSTNPPLYPALYPDCIAVGATNNHNQMSGVSVVDAKTEINAPGENIAAYRLGDVPELLSGTSQSTAIVAGICALIVSRMKALGMTPTPDAVKDLIARTAAPVVGSPSQKLISPLTIFENLKQTV